MYPVFVKGHLQFAVDDFQLEYVHQSISLFGVSGLPWPPLTPQQHFGREVKVSVRLNTPDQIQFATVATLMREQSLNSETLALRFKPNTASQRELDGQIRKYGFYPTEYVRKYPRMPASAEIPTFPLRGLLLTEELERKGMMPIVMDVSNLSPSGVLLHTENQSALQILPGTRVKLSIDPRGWFPLPVAGLGLVCRASDDVGNRSGNLTRYLGIKFIKLDEANKSIFTEMLKEILSRIQKDLDRQAGRS